MNFLSADNSYRDENFKYFFVNIQHDGTVSWVPGGLYTVFCPLKPTYFPFDVQKRSFDFESWAYKGWSLLDISFTLVTVCNMFNSMLSQDFMCHLKFFYFEIKGTKVRLHTKDSKTDISLLRLSGEWEFKGGVVKSTDYVYGNKVPFARITHTLHLKVLNSPEVVKCVDMYHV